MIAAAGCGMNLVMQPFVELQGPQLAFYSKSWVRPFFMTLPSFLLFIFYLNLNFQVGDHAPEEELRCKAECKESCFETSYAASVSYTALASTTTMKDFTQEIEAATNDSRFTEEYVKRNVIAIQTAFAQLVTDRTISKPSLELSAFLSTIFILFN